MYNKIIALIIALLVITGLSFSTSSFSAEPYKRSYFYHWNDEDNDGINARHEVLLRDAFPIEPIVMNEKGNLVVSGLWFCQYTLDFYTSAQDLDVDHFVPLKEAWLSGADKWTPEKREAFANYLGEPYQLVAVYDRANQAKGAKDPSEWLPTDWPLWNRAYMAQWIEIKEFWELCYDSKEMLFLNSHGFKVERECE